MKITRKSVLSGDENTLDLDVTQEELDAWAAGKLAQHAFPRLTPGQREFIISGITEEEWDSEFSDKDEEDEG